MGRRNRLHKMRIASGATMSLRETLKRKAQLQALSQIVNAGAPREQLLSGARAGLNDQARKLRKKGISLTMEGVMADLDAAPEFFGIVKKANISRADIEAIAQEVINAEAESPGVVADISSGAGADGVGQAA